MSDIDEIVPEIFSGLLRVFPHGMQMPHRLMNLVLKRGKFILFL